MRKYLIPVLALLMLFMVCAPAAATQLEVNNISYNPPAVLAVSEGTSFIKADALETIVGANVTVNEDGTFTIIKNDIALDLVTDSTQGRLNGDVMALPFAPYVDDNGALFVPLRSVLTILGAEVGWNAEAGTITITYEELVDGKTPMELVALSSAKFGEYNTYKATGNMNMNMSIEGMEDTEQTFNMQMTSAMDVQYQTEPFTAYVKQTIDMGEMFTEEMDQPLVTESLLLGSGMYINMPSVGWIEMDDLGMDMQSFIDQYNTQDPAAMLKFMEELGYIASYAGETTIDDNQYYVVNMWADPEKMMDMTRDMLPAATNGTDELDSLFTDMFNNMQFDFAFKCYIDKESYISDKMDMSVTLSMALPNPDKPEETATMLMNMDGNFTCYDFDEPLDIPEIDLESVMSWDDYMTTISNESVPADPQAVETEETAAEEPAEQPAE